MEEIRFNMNQMGKKAFGKDILRKTNQIKKFGTSRRAYLRKTLLY